MAGQKVVAQGVATLVKELDLNQANRVMGFIEGMLVNKEIKKAEKPQEPVKTEQTA